MKTALYDNHVALGAKMVDFNGWEMPIQYKQGIIHEHLTVRQAVGLFDVSHMGRLIIKGTDAERFLDYVCTNQIRGTNDLSVVYTVLPSSNGGSVDDALIYRKNAQEFYVIANAGNREKDRDHLLSVSHSFDVQIQDRYDDEGIIAVQGPSSGVLINELFPEAALLPYMNFMQVNYSGSLLIISRTGYTGSPGFEIYAPNKAVPELWNLLLRKGEKYGVAPIGLGARDTLRLEMGYALYGHELSDTIAPTESVSAWTVKFKKGDFLGKQSLIQLEQNPKKRSQYGILLLDKGIAREGYEVFKGDQLIGKITSGTHSPTLNKAIAIILVDQPLALGDVVEIQVRQNRLKAKIVKVPFLQNTMKS